jgi:hypothetical protein
MVSEVPDIMVEMGWQKRTAPILADSKQRKEECLHLGLSLFAHFIPYEPQAYGMVLPTFRAGLSLLFNSP